MLSVHQQRTAAVRAVFPGSMRAFVEVRKMIDLRNESGITLLAATKLPELSRNGRRPHQMQGVNQAQQFAPRVAVEHDRGQVE